MKIFVFALLIGLGIGYYSGYNDAHDGKPSIGARVLDKFGASKLRSAEAQREKDVNGVQ